MYPESLDVTEGESLEIPFFGKANSTPKKSKYSFLKVFNYQTDQIVLEDLYSSLQIARSDDGHFNIIKITDLQEGQYILKLKKKGKTITINVHKGEYWKENENIIMKRN